LRFAPALISPGVPAKSRVLILSLSLTTAIGKVGEVDVRSTPILAQEALAHGILTSADLVEKRRGSCGHVGLGVPGNLERVCIAATLPVFDGNQCRVVIHAAGF